MNSIKKAFNLHGLEETTYSVNLDIFEKAFDNARVAVNREMLLAFVKEVSGVKLILATIKNKLAECDNYNATLVNTHTSLYQVLGL